jgi:hypothetical protein
VACSQLPVSRRRWLRVQLQHPELTGARLGAGGNELDTGKRRPMAGSPGKAPAGLGAAGVVPVACSPGACGSQVRYPWVAADTLTLFIARQGRITIEASISAPQPQTASRAR